MSRRFDRHREPGQRQRAARAVTIPELIALLDTGRRLAAQALSEAEVEADVAPGGDHELTPFRIHLRDVQLDAFPGPSEVARLMFGAFLAAARAFSHTSAGPEARTACAAALMECARAADHFLTLHRTAQAEPWRRQFGDE